MPKVIENLRDSIIKAAKAELFRCGYKELNMRSIASKINTAVGTIYNYFPSKDMLAATIILEDWLKAVKEICQSTDEADSVDSGLNRIIEIISSFYEQYRFIFESSGVGNIKVIYPEKYEMLIRSVGDEVKKLLNHFAYQYDEFEISFIVTNIFACVSNNWSKEQTIHILKKIIKEN